MDPGHWRRLTSDRMTEAAEPCFHNRRHGSTRGGALSESNPVQCSPFGMTWKAEVLSPINILKLKLPGHRSPREPSRAELRDIDNNVMSQLPAFGLVTSSRYHSGDRPTTPAASGSMRTAWWLLHTCTGRLATQAPVGQTRIGGGCERVAIFRRR